MAKKKATETALDAELPSVGQTYGKWRIAALFEVDGEPWARIVNTKNLQASSRVPVSDLAKLGGS